MTVDVRALEWSVTVGGVDCSDIRLSLDLSTNQFDLSGWSRVSGTLTLGTRVHGSAINTNPRSNPIWSPGTAVVVVIQVPGYGSLPLPWPLVIQRRPARPTWDRPELVIPVCDLATLRNYRAPEGAPTGGSFAVVNTRRSLINLQLTQAGLPTLTDEIGDPLVYSPQKVEGGSWLDFAGEIAAATNAILYQQADGAVRAATLGGLLSLSPALHIREGIDELALQPTDSDEAPPQTVRATGSYYALTEITEDPVNINIEVDSELVGDYQATYSSTSSSRTTIERHRQRLGDVFPAQFPGNTSLTTVRRITTVRNYGGGVGRLTSTGITEEAPRGLVGPELFTTSLTTLMTERRTTTTLTYVAQDRISKRDTTTEEPAFRVKPSAFPTTSTLIPAEILREDWTKRGRNYLYTPNLIPLREGQEPQPPSASGSSQPPGTEYLPPVREREEIPLEGEATFGAFPGASEADGKLQIISMAGGLNTSTAQLDAIALAAGRIRQGRAFSWRWATSIVPAFLASYTPVKRLDLSLLNGDGTATRYAYLIDGLTLALDRTQATMGGSAVELGAVAADGSGTPTPPYS